MLWKLARLGLCWKESAQWGQSAGAREPSSRKSLRGVYHQQAIVERNPGESEGKSTTHVRKASSPEQFKGIWKTPKLTSDPIPIAWSLDACHIRGYSTGQNYNTPTCIKGHLLLLFQGSLSKGPKESREYGLLSHCLLQGQVWSRGRKSLNWMQTQNVNLRYLDFWCLKMKSF